MKSLDAVKAQKSQIMEGLAAAIQENDSEKFSKGFTDFCELLQNSILEDARALSCETDKAILASRGVRQLTGTEIEYYSKFRDALRAPNPQQALKNVEIIMPKTIIDSVFEDLKEDHVLLSNIDFRNTSAITEILINRNGKQKAVWGKLCEEIVKELESGFELVGLSLLKLSAFLPVCKAMLDVGVEWLDVYVRQVLSEALANGLEEGILMGNGKNEPIGMDKQVGSGITIIDGVYPDKDAIMINDLSAATLGNLVSLLAVGLDGKSRTVKNLILVVNSQDYYQRIIPATSFLAVDGTYKKDVLPVDAKIIPVACLPRGKAIFGIAKKYFMGIGTSKGGKIEFSDEYKFLEDERMYAIKMYGNGFPLDNNAFMVLDISELKPAKIKVEAQSPDEPSNNADLSGLSVGGLTLTPKFDRNTTSYAVNTTNATNTIQALPADAGAEIEIKNGNTIINNGSAATWQTGDNTITVLVTAGDGETQKTYTITVSKEA